MRRFAFFPGCLIPARHPAMEFAIRHTLQNLGIEIVDLEGTSCCPDPIYFKSKDKLSWLAVAARNLTLAEDIAGDVGYDWLWIFDLPEHVDGFFLVESAWLYICYYQVCAFVVLGELEDVLDWE